MEHGCFGEDLCVCWYWGGGEDAEALLRRGKDFDGDGGWWVGISRRDQREAGRGRREGEEGLCVLNVAFKASISACLRAASAFLSLAASFLRLL